MGLDLLGTQRSPVPSFDPRPRGETHTLFSDALAYSTPSDRTYLGKNH